MKESIDSTKPLYRSYDSEDETTRKERFNSIIQKVHQALGTFLTNNPDFISQFEDHSPYYSGHEWSDERREEVSRSIAKPEEESGLEIIEKRKGYTTAYEIIWESESISILLKNQSDSLLSQLFLDLHEIVYPTEDQAKPHQE